MIRPFLLTLALFAALTPAAKADPVEFAYAFSLDPTGPFASGTGSVTFSLFGNGALAANVGDETPIQAATLLTTSSALANEPDAFDAAYTLRVSVTDVASSQSHDFDFGGRLSGTLTFNASDLTARFNGPLSMSHVLGTYEYIVSVEPELANIPPPGSLTDVLLNANVRIFDTEQVVIGYMPEPSALVLGLLAGPGAWLLRRRAARPAV